MTTSLPSNDSLEEPVAMSCDGILPLAEIMAQIGEGAPTLRTLQRWARSGRFETSPIVRGGKKVQGASLGDVLNAVAEYSSKEDGFSKANDANAAIWEESRSAFLSSLNGHSAQMSEFISSYKGLLTELEKVHECAVSDLEQAHELAVAELVNECDRRCNDLKTTFEVNLQRCEIQKGEAKLWGRIALGVGVGSMLVALVVALTRPDAGVSVSPGTLAARGSSR